MPSTNTLRLVASILGALFATAACSVSSSSPEPFNAAEDDTGAHSEALLADSPRCDLESLASTIGRACTEESEKSYWRVPLAPPDATGLDSLRTSASYSLRLRPDGAGKVGFVPAESGDYAFYLGTPNVPFAVESVDGSSVPPTCSRYLPDAVKETLLAGDCTRRKGVYIFRLEADHAYTIEVGPLAPPHAFVTLRLEVARVSRAVSQSDCANQLDGSILDASIGAQLQTLCALGGTEVPINGRLLSSPTGARLEPSVAHGVHLVGNYEAALEFVPPRTGNYLVGLGTRANTPKLAMRMLTQTQASACSPSPALLSEALPEDCAFRGFTKVSLRQGEPLRLELSGADSLRWVRTAIIPYQPAPPACSDLRLLFLSGRYAPPKSNVPSPVSATEIESWLPELKAMAASARLGLATFQVDEFSTEQNPRLLSGVPLTSEAGQLGLGATGSAPSLLPLWLVALSPQEYGFGPEGGYVVLYPSRLPSSGSPCVDCRGIELECDEGEPTCDEGNCAGHSCWPATPCPACYPNDGDGIQEPGETPPTIRELRVALERANLVPVFLASASARTAHGSQIDLAHQLISELGRGKVAPYSSYDHKPLGRSLSDLVLPQLTETCFFGASP